MGKVKKKEHGAVNHGKGWNNIANDHAIKKAPDVSHETQEEIPGLVIFTKQSTIL